MSRPLRVVPCPARGWGAREGCGEHQVPPHTVSCPVGTELGDEISPRMGSLDMPRKTGKESIQVRSDGGNVEGTWLV